MFNTQYTNLCLEFYSIMYPEFKFSRSAIETRISENHEFVFMQNMEL